MATLESRLAKLEAQATPRDNLLEQAIASLPPLNAAGEFDWNTGNEYHQELSAMLERIGNEAVTRDYKLKSAIDRAVACMVEFSIDENANPLLYERYRRRVPARILAALYGRVHNYALSPDVALRVRQLAGIVDENGKPFDGYRLADNGYGTVDEVRS